MKETITKIPHLNDIISAKIPTPEKAKEELVIVPRKSTDRRSLSDKIAILRSKYMLNGELEQDIIQLIVEEIGQGLRPK